MASSRWKYASALLTPGRSWLSWLPLGGQALRNFSWRPQKKRPRKAKDCFSAARKPIKIGLQDLLVFGIQYFEY
jgi:hypothetical protein